MSAKDQNAPVQFAPALESVDQLALVIRSSRFYEFYHRTRRNADGTPQRWRMNGQLKRWIRDRNRMRLPIKQGMYTYSVIESIDDFSHSLSVGYIDAAGREHGVMNPSNLGDK